jgi:hypothetical protein
MISFIYTDQIPDNLSDVAESLLKLADFYEIHPLKDACEQSLIKGLSLDTADHILVLSHLHNCVQLMSKAMDLIVMHAKEIMEKESWKTVEKLHPELVNEIAKALAAKLDDEKAK